MNAIPGTEKIRYIEAFDHPLSAEIGVIEEGKTHWLYDVGNGDAPLSGLTGSYHVVLSHFHPDHTGNIGRLRVEELYLSKETYAALFRETAPSCGIHIIKEPVRVGNLHIFPLPSSHAKGCLGLEIDDTYAFVGDGLYCRSLQHTPVYNAQLLKEEIQVLSRLKAPFLLVSHFENLVRRREEVLSELKEIYGMRTKDSPFISVEGLQ